MAALTLTHKTIATFADGHTHVALTAPDGRQECIEVAAGQSLVDAVAAVFHETIELVDEAEIGLFTAANHRAHNVNRKAVNEYYGY